MAIPSGSGTEVLKRRYFPAVTNSPINVIDGVADHTYTVLSISFCEQGNASELIHLFLEPDADGTNPIYFIGSQTLGAHQTFVWNDKIVLMGTDELCFQTSDSANIDVLVSYIDQDWT